MVSKLSMPLPQSVWCCMTQSPLSLFYDLLILIWTLPFRTAVQNRRHTGGLGVAVWLQRREGGRTDVRGGKQEKKERRWLVGCRIWHVDEENSNFIKNWNEIIALVYTCLNFEGSGYVILKRSRTYFIKRRRRRRRRRGRRKEESEEEEEEEED